VIDGIARVLLRELIVPNLPCVPCSLGLGIDCYPLVRLWIVWKLLVDRAAEVLKLRPLEIVVRFKLMAHARAPVVVGLKFTFTSVLTFFQIWGRRTLFGLGSTMWY